MAGRLTAAGAVLFRRTRGGARFLLLRHAEGHWDFPKGRRERGESLAAAMRREVREESGLDRFRLVPGFVRRLTWPVTYDGVRYRKAVVYRLAEATAGRVRISSEHRAFRWLPAARALKLLRFANARALLRAAAGHLARRGE